MELLEFSYAESKGSEEMVSAFSFCRVQPCINKSNAVNEHSLSELVTEIMAQGEIEGNESTEPEFKRNNEQ